jgi:menaquinone-dependent protoporphyrinogen oxidase
MKLLVAAASKHGSTLEIAEAIAEELRAAGADVDLREAGGVSSIEDYDGVVLGSAIYMGNPMKEARQFADRHHEALLRLPVWLFTSGPIGDEDPKPEGDPAGLPPLVEAAGALEHMSFTGKLDRKQLSLLERAAVKAVKAPYGDFRDWDGIRAWARSIAERMEDARPG